MSALSTLAPWHIFSASPQAPKSWPRAWPCWVYLQLPDTIGPTMENVQWTYLQVAFFSWRERFSLAWGWFSVTCFYAGDFCWKCFDHDVRGASFFVLSIWHYREMGKIFTLKSIIQQTYRLSVLISITEAENPFWDIGYSTLLNHLTPTMSSRFLCVCIYIYMPKYAYIHLNIPIYTYTYITTPITMYI